MKPFLHSLIQRLPRTAALLLLAPLVLLAAQAAAQAPAPLPVLTLSVLQFGTPHWELEHLKRRQLDRANGFELKVRLVADLPASRLAVTSGSVDGAVGDLLWTQARHAAGTSHLYLPFSSQIGEILVPEGSEIRQLADLAGKRIGVAGGPDGLGWRLLQEAASREGIDLAKRAQVQFAAPPLLGQALRRGQVDALLTYWHFAARMRGEGGVRQAFAMQDLLAGFGLQPDQAVLGYVFPQPWADANRALLSDFAAALRQTKQELTENPAHWQAIRPLLRADDEAVFAELRAAFIDGTPQPLDEGRIAELQRLLLLTGADPSRVMPAELFFRAQP
jgi:NitT/TauT family transport system substrate-binding protein